MQLSAHQYGHSGPTGNTDNYADRSGHLNAEPKSSSNLHPNAQVTNRDPEPGCNRDSEANAYSASHANASGDRDGDPQTDDNTAPDSDDASSPAANGDPSWDTGAYDHSNPDIHCALTYADYRWWRSAP